LYQQITYNHVIYITFVIVILFSMARFMPEIVFQQNGIFVHGSPSY